MASSPAPATELFVPPSIIASLDEYIQSSLLDLAIRFESIDQLVAREFDSPHEIIRNPSRSREDDTGLGPFTYNPADKDQFADLVKEHAPDEVLTYLGDRRHSRYWSIVFNAYCKTWGRGSIYWPDMAQARIHEVEGLANGLDELFERPSLDPGLPRYVKDGVKIRLRTLNTFLDTCEKIMVQHDRGSRNQYDTYETKPPLVMFPQRRRVARDPAPRAIPPAAPRGILSKIVSDRSVIALTGLITVAGTALELAAFYGTKAYTKADFSLAELYNYLQAFLISTLGLAITVLPLQKESLSRHASGWVNWWAGLSLLTGVLAPSLYYVVGSAWANMLSTASSICTAFITLQLIQALKRADEAEK